MRTNLDCFVTLLEQLRRTPGTPVVYASSSSVYGSSPLSVSSETDATDDPESLYGATKKSSELFAHVYHLLYEIPVTGACVGSHSLCKQVPLACHAGQGPPACYEFTAMQSVVPPHAVRWRPLLSPRSQACASSPSSGRGGRPDMAYFHFTHAIYNCLPIQLFGEER